MKLRGKNFAGLGCLNKARQALGTSLTNAVIGGIVGQTEQKFADLITILEAYIGYFVNKDGKHLKGNILFFNLIGDDVHGIAIACGLVWGDLAENL